MPDVPPLGSLPAFSGFTGPTMWGPDGTWPATFGSGEFVIEDLIRGLKAHPEAVRLRWPAKAEPYAVVLGCIPWLTHVGVAEALADMSGCIVIDKPVARHPVVQKLAREGRGVWQMLLGMETWGPRDEDGQPPWIGPNHLPGDRPLESVRVIGYRGDRRPLMHAKLAVCCGAWRWDNDFGGWTDYLTPLAVWFGSANWTRAAPRHIEYGAWTTDEQFCQRSLEFIVALVKASEPLGSAAPGPLPELVHGQWDDAAMAEAWDAYLSDHPEECPAEDDYPDEP